MPPDILCIDDLLDTPDVNCDEDKNTLITGFYMANVGSPLVLPVKLTPAETDAARLAREILRRMSITVTTDPERMRFMKVYRGVMPQPTPTYQTNPNTGTQRLPAQGVDMRVEGTDYRWNDNVINFWRNVTSGTTKLFFFQDGNQLMGDGLKGVKGTVTAAAGIVDGSEITHRTGWGVNWKGNPIPVWTRIGV